LTTALLHFYKSLTEWIGTPRKILAGKGIAVPEAMGDLIHLGAGQDGAGLTQQLLLKPDFLGGLRACARSAGRAQAFYMKSAHVAVDTTSRSRHFVLSFVLDKSL
jgi:hypothetical protein